MTEYIMRYENEYLQLLPDKMQPLVRCKDCKHRPKVVSYKNATGVTQTHYEFPEDSKCPCQNTNDDYYSWCPDDNWFCADGEAIQKIPEGEDERKDDKDTGRCV